MRDNDFCMDDLFWVADHLPVQGSIVALNEEQRSYLLAAAKRYGVRRTWGALSRAVQTDNYNSDDVVEITWTLLKSKQGSRIL